MRGVVIAAGRRVLAASVLLISGLLAVWAATFKVWYLQIPEFGGKADYVPGAPAPVPHADCIAGGVPCAGVSPAWTIPVAIAIMLIGVVLAASIHWRRRGRAELRAVNLAS